MSDFDDLFRLSQALLKVHLRPYRRSFLQNEPFASRFSMVLGHRGVGKTTAMAGKSPSGSSAFCIKHQ